MRLTSRHAGTNAGDMLQLRAPLVSLGLSCLLAAACGDDGASGGSGDGGGGAGSGPSSGPGAGTGLASVDPGSPHTPETGCFEGFTACGDVCADLTNDYRHCGACETTCAFVDTLEVTTHCVEGACVPVPCEDPGCYCMSAICDGACRTGMSYDADNCGSCANQCADDELCTDGQCAEAGGRGASCGDPLILDVDEVERIGFRWSAVAASDHVFVCGPLEAVPTRWFRVTVPAEELEIAIEGDPLDDYIIEVFTDESCAEEVSLSCSDGEVGDEVEITDIAVTPGSTFWIAVGLKNEWTGVSGMINIEN